MPVALLNIVIFAVSLILTLAMVPPLIRIASNFELFDHPDNPGAVGALGRKVHSNPVPRIGGIAIASSFFLTQIIWQHSSALNGAFIGAAVIFLLGLIDDLINVRAVNKFAIQTFVAAITVYYCGLFPGELLIVPNNVIVLSPMLGTALGTFIIVGAINTLNMVDGLDGLAGGIALIGFILLSFLHLISGHDPQRLFFVVAPIIGAIIGFLRYNTHPAVIFMGDSGSNWLGFMVGIVMLLLLQSNLNSPATHTVPLISVISCMAIPILDTATVMVGRWRRGVSPMAADKTHLHHALLRIGLTHSQAVSTMYFLALSIGVLGILPVAFPNHGLELAPYFGLGLVTFIVLGASKLQTNSTLGLISRRAEIRSTKEYTWISRIIKYWENINRYILYIVFIGGPAFAGTVKPIMGYTAIAVSALIFVSMFKGLARQSSDFFDASCVALGATVLLIVNNANLMTVEWQGARVNIHHIYNGLFAFLMISTVLLVLVTAKKRYLVVKPSDFLFLTLPLVLLLMPEQLRSEYKINVISLRSIVVFAAVRTLASRKPQILNEIKGVALAALLFVYLAGVFGLKIVY